MEAPKCDNHEVPQPPWPSPLPRRDPFRGPGNFLAMCDCHIPPQVDQEGNKISEMVPHPGNSRAPAAAIFEKCKAQKPWFGIEQEYTLLAPNSLWPVGWPKNGYPGPQGPYYCAAGAGASIARDVADLHLKICLYAGVNISGVNGEVMPAQWEYQVGPCEGIDMGDELWMSRYLLYRWGRSIETKTLASRRGAARPRSTWGRCHSRLACLLRILRRVCEMYNVIVTFDPKPIPGDWNGAGGHTNYSNEDTRKPEVGFENIKKQIEKLKKKHAEHIAAYGEGNERRLTGLHETSSMNDFSWGVANRGCSIRVGRMVPVEKVRRDSFPSSLALALRRRQPLLCLSAPKCAVGGHGLGLACCSVGTTRTAAPLPTSTRTS